MNGTKRAIARRTIMGCLAGVLAAPAIGRGQEIHHRATAWWQLPADTLAYRDAEEVRLAPTIASRAPV
jgi:hypothetical protein